jgi:APA family basic amino acid/polyamine antiporter
MTTRTNKPGELKVTVLRRALGTWGATAFVITNMIGTGIFTVPAFVRTATGSGLSALAVWVTGAVLALSGALCYAELATRMPQAGGEYHYLTRIYGRLFGFLSGWISFLVGFSAAIAASSLGASAYAAKIIPFWNPEFVFFSIGNFQLTLGSVGAAGLIALLSAFHCSGVKPGGRLQGVIAGSVIGAIVLLFIAGLFSGQGNWQGITAGTASFGGLWWVALIQVDFAYTGWNAAAYLAGEVANPRRTLPLALAGGTITVAALYLLLNVLFLYALPGDAWEAKIAVGNLAAEHLFGSFGARVVSLLVTLIIIGSVSAMVAAGPRVYYAMSRDGLAHTVFAHLSPRTGAPIFAIVMQAAVAMMLALTGAFQELLIYAGSALSLFTALAIAALYFIPRHEDKDNPQYFRVPGYPFTPAIFILVTLLTFIQGLRESPRPTGAALLTILAGVGIYYLAKSRGWLREISESSGEENS